jgi:beta-lactamase class A
MKTLRHHISLLLVISLLSPIALVSQSDDTNDVVMKIRAIINPLKGHVGVGIMDLDADYSVTVNGLEQFPMQSVYKFPLAIAILNMVDEGRLSLEQNVHIPGGSLDTNTWSPLVTDFPNQDINITLAELIDYTVGKSDNNGCDVLFQIAGGTEAVNRYIHGLGVEGIAIAATEKEMKQRWEVQYTNWCQPAAMLQLLQIFYDGRALSRESNQFLMKVMTEGVNPANRIKRMLPEDAVVAHKTGTGNTNDEGITSATNDVGIVTLPDGRRFAIVVYVSDYKGGIERGSRAIAEIAKLAWDHFTVR